MRLQLLSQPPPQTLLSHRHATRTGRGLTNTLESADPASRLTRRGRRFGDSADRWLAENDPRYVRGRKARGY